MPTALASLNRLQLGKETAAGTAVAATAVIPGAAEFEETIEFYRPQNLGVTLAMPVSSGQSTSSAVSSVSTLSVVPRPVMTPAPPAATRTPRG
jgi:hypothetical protein